MLDPDTNFLQHVKFFLEPLNDGSLPAYNIQRDIFTALTRLNIEKETLLSSGIGKVVLFYTRSKKPEPSIKRMAERLLGEWSRPILKRTDDYKKRHIETREFDYEYVHSSLPLFYFIASILSLSLYISLMADTMDDTGLPKWLNAANKAPNSLSLSDLHSRQQMPNVNDSLPPSVVATRLVWSIFPPVTQLLLSAHLMATRAKITGLSVLEEWKLSGE